MKIEQMIERLVKEASQRQEKVKERAKENQDLTGNDWDISDKDHGEVPQKVKEILSTWPYHVIEEVEYAEEDWNWLINYQN